VLGYHKDYHVKLIRVMPQINVKVKNDTEFNVCGRLTTRQNRMLTHINAVMLFLKMVFWKIKYRN